MKIISGVYGYRPLNSRFVEAAHTGETRIVSDAECQRLEKLGIGVCVGDCADYSAPPDPDALRAQTKDTLTRIAETWGCDLTGCKTKADIVQAVMQAQQADNGGTV